MIGGKIGGNRQRAKHQVLKLGLETRGEYPTTLTNSTFRKNCYPGLNHARLLTNREANTLAEAAECVDWYRCRWEIEMFFNILKNGCKVEALQLSAMPRIELALALFMIIAWRIGYLMRLGRACPEMDCEVVFDHEEWQAAWLVARKPLPKTPPTLNDAIRLIATFGGFLGRKGDGEPGAKSLWHGLQRVMDFAMGIRAAQEAEICV